MSNAGPQIERDRPPYIRFERRAVEDRTKETMDRLKAEGRAGQFGYKDVDFVLVTPAGSKDVFEREVGPWFEYNRMQVQAGRLNPQWQAAYEFAYEQFKKGQDVPLSGTPLKTWPPLSPSQLKSCLDANVRTVEDLANANDEGLRLIGMGAALLKQRAVDWLRDAKGPGAMAMELTQARADLQTANQRIADQDEKIALLANTVKMLEARLPQDTTTRKPAAETPAKQEIRAEEVLEEDSPAELAKLVDQHKEARQGVPEPVKL